MTPPGTGTPRNRPKPLTPPAAVPAAAQEADAVLAPCGAFAGRIIEITSLKDAVKVLVGLTPVVAPYWTPAMVPTLAALPASQSTHPAAVPTGTGSAVEMSVKITVTKATGLSGTSTLTGTLGRARWQGTFPSRVGTHTVTVRMAAATTMMAAHRGDIAWQAQVPGCGLHQLGRTRVEIYRISAPIAPRYLVDGRPVAGLRFVYDKVKVAGIDVATDAGDTELVAAITGYLHVDHGVTYDIYRGAPGFVRGNVTGALFDLSGYIGKKGRASIVGPKGAYVWNVANCYDQAAAVQVFSGIAGVDGHTRYVQPFGFIPQTVLVGGVLSNSPFYGSAKTAPIVSRTAPNRTQYGNHQFYMDKGSTKVFDACVGPHLGTESYDSYMSGAVDTDMTAPGQTGGSLGFWRRKWTTSDNFLTVIALF